MADACCINAYINGNLDHTIEVLQSGNIGQDICRCIENYNDREVDYICYIDKCGCHCCLSNENEIIIHTTNGTIKTATFTGTSGQFTVKWGEIFGGNWSKTMVRYRTDTYPTSITDGTLAVEETTQNTYCSTGYTKTGLTSVCAYIRIFALDGNNNILASCCGTALLWSNQSYGYSGAIQSFQIPAGTYCLQVRGAGGMCACNSRGGGYSYGCITIPSTTTMYVNVGQHPTSCTGGYNGGGTGRCNGGGGGGATDIRIGGNTIYHRILVAGGSGGCGSSTSYFGGAGGGCNGMAGSSNCPCCTGTGRDGGGGTQTQGGKSWCSCSAHSGSFGQGGSGSLGYKGGGGGGGWYGGAAAYDNDSDADGKGGGGGSGYTWSADTCSSHPCPSCLSTSYYLTGYGTCAGCETFPGPTGTNETGHLTNGCAKITRI